jgi:serine/threonine-protein kinase
MSDAFESLVIGARYRLVRRLGSGGMGSVWLAEHLSLYSPVAVKLLSEAVATSEEGLSRFWREARTSAALRSPHVVQILDYGVEDSRPYLVMELLDGESLDVRLQRTGRLSPEQVAHVFHHIGRAVGLAHDAGIVHRDLKPSNIFIISNDDEEVIKLLDFGIAKARVDRLGDPLKGGTRTGEFLGTPYYTSPEQAEGDKSLDHRTDIWAMGVVAYECLLGRQPFAGETLGSVLLAICSRPLPVPSEHGAVPAGFDAWFARACARNVALRYQSAREAAGALRSLCLAAASADEGAEKVQSPERLPALASSADDVSPSSAPPPSSLSSSAPQPSEPSESSRQLPSSLTTTGAASSARALEKIAARPRPRALAVALGGLVVLGGACWQWRLQRKSAVSEPESVSAAALPVSPVERASVIIAPVVGTGVPPQPEVQQAPETKSASSPTDEAAVSGGAVAPERTGAEAFRAHAPSRSVAGRPTAAPATKKVRPSTSVMLQPTAGSSPPDNAAPAQPAAADPPDPFGLTRAQPKPPAPKVEPSIDFGLLPKAPDR